MEDGKRLTPLRKQDGMGIGGRQMRNQRAVCTALAMQNNRQMRGDKSLRACRHHRCECGRFYEVEDLAG
jgi:hypothetical protein